MAGFSVENLQVFDVLTCLRSFSQTAWKTRRPLEYFRGSLRPLLWQSPHASERLVLSLLITFSSTKRHHLLLLFLIILLVHSGKLIIA